LIREQRREAGPADCHTAAEFRKLFDRAGFALDEIVPTRLPLSIVVGRPLA
jgi:hypothetical protein